MQKVLISAGEASGDLHASNLVKELKKLNPSVAVTAMGADKLRAAGAEVIIDCSDLAVVGLIEVLINYRKIKSALNRLIDWVEQHKPDLVILVDYQEFNMRLAEAAKKRGIKVLFYVGPQVWAWRSHRVYSIKRKVDMMAVLFPFEVEFYSKANVPVRFVGNPLVDEVKASASKQELMTEFGLSDQSKIVGLLPGSRRSEIKRILPIQLESAKRLRQQFPDLQFALAVASTLNVDEVKQYCLNYADLNIQFIQQSPYDVMQVCDAIITASGTATLETGLMGIPMVITYKISGLSYAILRRMMTITRVGLVNIVAEQDIVKELIQDNAKPELIANEIAKILTDTDYRETMIAKLSQVKQKLGTSGGSKLVAELAQEMLAS